MSQLGWWPFSSEEADEVVGQRLLSAYYNQAINFPEFPWTSFDLWLAHLNSKVPEFDKLVGELVKMNYASTTEAQAQDRLVELANQSAGEASPSQIVAVAGGKGDSINWSAAIPEIASESAADVTAVVQNVGKGVLGTLNMTKYLPWILLGAGALFIYTQGGAIKGVMEKFKG